MSRCLPLFLAAVAFLYASENHVSMADCSFLSRPDDFQLRESRARREVYERAAKMNRSFAGSRPALQPAADIPRRNFIDDEIFGALSQKGVLPAPVATDEEFLRRIHLDLTGRTPTPADIRAFLADTSPSKRKDAVERLLYSGEFGHRWTLWMGDLLQNTPFASNVSIQIDGRNAFYVWLRNAVFGEKSFKDIAYEAVTAAGNNYDHASGAANFAVRARTPMGPAQDTFDAMLSRTASSFLGVAYYDCLLCHDGRRHLDEISLWGGRTKRVEAQTMAAFFSRQRLVNSRVPRGEFYYNSIAVADNATGAYQLDTTFGNRPARQPIGAVRSLMPEYRNGGKSVEGLNWRESFAQHMVQDPLFAMNAANRIWKQFFSMGLVEPVDTLDPDRLDPNNPPPAPWALQATHPRLLVRLAEEFRTLNFNYREFIKLLLNSSAYQLSSRYEGEWKFEYVPLFARHYPRRIEGEEVHDVVVNATGVTASYALQGLDPVEWAVQLPDPSEPRRNGGPRLFMDAFLRGNRDTQQRSQSGSIFQQMYLMNDPFVLSRIRVAASPKLQAAARLTSNEALVEEVFLLFLSRKPDAAERSKAVAHLAKAGSAAARNAAVEDLAWMCANKLEFLFSY